MITRAAMPLSPPDRSAFLEAVAAALAEQPEIGDGVVGRISAEQQRVFLVGSVRARDGARKWY